MPQYIEKAESLTLPLVLLRGSVVFPSVKISFEVSDKASMAAAEAASECNSFVFLVTSREPDVSDISVDSVFTVGTVAKIKQTLKTPNGSLRLVVEGYSRASVSRIAKVKKYYAADVICKTISAVDEPGVKGEALMREALSAFESVVRYLPAVSHDIMLAAQAIQNVGLLADFMASNVLLKYTDKQMVLEQFEPIPRLETLIMLLENEAVILSCEADIQKQVRERLNRNQKDYYLREQIKVIQDELGEDSESEEAEYKKRILDAKLPEEVKNKLLKENEKAGRMPFGSAETNVIRNHIDICLGLPWNKKTNDRLDIAKARKILDNDHDGLEKVKERILEYLAVKQLAPELKNQILCLVGPPGVGKTSVAASIAKAMNRKYVRVSLGGVRDEADIRGHRKTYIASMPGRIMTALSQAGVNNPLILLDEIDKLTRDSHGDPSSALLEVLDAEQNKNFRDHFVEFPFDLSDCLFIATANSYDGIPRPLLDRMEVIELKIYTKREKLEIAKNHLIPKQLKRHGLTKKTLKINDRALIDLIDYYTREAGVRNLEREIASICRKAAKALIETNAKCISVTEKNLSDFLGVHKLLPEHIDTVDQIGSVNGLAYTELGGEMLKIEVAVLEGTGKIEITGSLGDVMQESAKIAVSLVRSLATEYDIPTDFYKTKDIHIHAPQGAVPKDGPSAGVTITTALVSALTERPVRRDIAMTGEISLRGNVLAIGGLKEKTMAAYSAGVKTVLIPHDNLRDLEEIDPLARENLTFVPCEKISEVLERALLPAKTVSKKETLDVEKLPEIGIRLENENMPTANL